MEIIKITLTAFSAGLLISIALIYVLKGMGLLDTPGGRKIHDGNIPSMGGISFIAAAFISMAIWLDYTELTQIRYLLASILLMFVVGIRDDITHVTALQKLAAQFVAAYLVVVLGDIRLTGFYGFLGIYDLPLYVSYLITIFTIAALTNAFNLIDGIDGLAGGLALVILAFLGWWFWEAGLRTFSYFSLALAAGVVSFLLFNWYPARIFMGDTGSLSLGFALSVMTVLFIHTNATALGIDKIQFEAPLATGMAIFIIPIYDTIQVILRRISKGKSPLNPENLHIHHYLNRLGMKPDQVSVLLIGIKLGFIFLIFLSSDLNDNVMVPMVLLGAVTLGTILNTFHRKRPKRIIRR
jgi:UDP-N-acetylmuramyl pentapeptide phosphotransferase/UDP-N-acetylglucosamine-1-phosphate transferase